MGIPTIKEAKETIKAYPTIESYINANGFFTRSNNVVILDIRFEDRLYYQLCQSVVKKSK